MQASYVQLHTGEINSPHERVGKVEASRRKASAFSPDPTLDEVNLELQRKAAELGSNAVLNVRYHRGMTLFSHQFLKAWGDAVRADSVEVACPFCAETIKRAAIKCRHCGELLPEKQASGTISC